jgi:hypothetical protein
MDAKVAVEAPRNAEQDLRPDEADADSAADRAAGPIPDRDDDQDAVTASTGPMGAPAGRDSAAPPASGPASGTSSGTSSSTSPTPVPEPRPPAEAEPDAERGKSKRPRKAVRSKSAGGTKALVVWREGKVHYADDSVLVIDLDEVAAADVDVHDVVDRLAELREALDSPGRAEAVTVLAEIIQEKALS